MHVHGKKRKRKRKEIIEKKPYSSMLKTKKQSTREIETQKIFLKKGGVKIKAYYVKEIKKQKQKNSD